MTPELQGLIAALRRGDCLWSSLTLEQIRNAYAMSQGRNRDAPIALEEPICPQQDRKGKKVKRVEASADPSNASLGAEPLKRARRTPERRSISLLLATPVSVAIPVHEDQSASHVPVESDAGGDRVDSRARQTVGQGLNEVVSADLSSSSSMPPPVTRAPGEGTSHFFPTDLPPDGQGDSSLAFFGADARSRGLRSDGRRECKGINEYVALMEARLVNFLSREELEGQLLMIQQLRSKLSASQANEQHRAKEVEDLKLALVACEAEKDTIMGDLESLKEKFKRQAENREKAVQKERRSACRSIAKGYDAALDKVRENLQKRKADNAAGIWLQEVRANIEALTEYSKGGFELEEEVAHLKGVETSLEIDYGMAAMSDDSTRRLDLPQVSDDSINQGHTDD
ncbi:Uncharacterized protein Rs2_15791 [Raphanus sativus]|nr:Uncharacterized protein Rs2_15791 [Raphanus sativus]